MVLQLIYLYDLLNKYLNLRWHPKADILMAFWEYFHKKLNSPFFLQGSAPSTMAVIR